MAAEECEGEVMILVLVLVLVFLDHGVHDSGVAMPRERVHVSNEDTCLQTRGDTIKDLAAQLLHPSDHLTQAGEVCACSARLLEFLIIPRFIPPPRFPRLHGCIADQGAQPPSPKGPPIRQHSKPLDVVDATLAELLLPLLALRS